MEKESDLVKEIIFVTDTKAASSAEALATAVQKDTSEKVGRIAQVGSSHLIKCSDFPPKELEARELAATVKAKEIGIIGEVDYFLTTDSLRIVPAPTSVYSIQFYKKMD